MNPSAGRIILRLILPLFCVVSIVAAGEPSDSSRNYVIKVWGPDDGLTEGSVTDVAQTPEGYLWLGTLFGSVLRFDGARFVSYSSANTPQFSLKWGVPRLMVDDDGTLWISMYDGGLTTWDHSGFRSIFTSTNRPDDLLWSAPGKVIFVCGGNHLLEGSRNNGQWNWKMAEPPGALPQPQFCADSAGNVWYLRGANQVGVWDGSMPRTIAVEAQEVTTLASDGVHRIWIGTDQSLEVWQKGRFEVMTPTNGEPLLNVRRLIAAGGSNLWVSANGRIRCCVGRRWVAEAKDWNQELGRHDAFRFFLGDREGGFWTSADDLGLIHVSADGDLVRLTTRNGLPSNTIRFAYQDHDGNIWTGYDRGELVQVRRRLFGAIGKSEGLSDSLINTVSEDAGGVLWIGTHSGAVICCKDGVCTNMAVPGMKRSQDSCVAVGNGQVWIGAEGAGLLSLKDGRVTTVAGATQLDSYPRILLPTREGDLWAGTLFSIVRVKARAFDVEYTAQSVGGHPTALSEARDGTIWAGTLEGNLMRWDGKQFVTLEPPEKNSLGRIWALWPADDGSLWAGTEEGGLLHLSHGRFFRYTTRNGLPSNCIEEVLGDVSGNLWVGTRVGIARIPAHAFARVEQGDARELPVSVYGLTDGLMTIGSAIINQPNCWRGRDGTLFFAMANSVAEVNPDHVRVNADPPEVTLEKMVADDKKLFPARAGAILTAWQGDGIHDSSPSVVDVAPGRGDLEFDYTVLSFSSPRSRFQYRLQGLESSWNEAGSERKAIYHHVPPGHYIFEARACNSDSIWSGDEALVVVNVAPFFYQTLWFRGGIFLLVVALLTCTGAVVMRGRMRRRMEQLERQHALERERARIAQDLHDDLGAGLTEIGLLGGMLHETPDTSRRHEAVERIVERCHEMVTGLDEIVWAVNPRNDSVKSLGAYLCRYAQRFLEPAIRCRLEMPLLEQDSPLNSEQRHNLFLAFKEALTNVARHAQAREVRIRIVVRDSSLLIEVEDDGRGLGELHEVHGNGLNNLRNRMAEIGGQCHIANRPGGGVSVGLSLCLKDGNGRN